MHGSRVSDADRPTDWQARRQEQRAIGDRVMGILYGLLAVAAILYFLAVMEAIRPVL